MADEKTERRDRGVAAMRKDGDFKEAGPSLAATKEGRLLDNGPERTGVGRSDAENDKLDKILAHLGDIHDILGDYGERLDAVERGRKDGDDSEGAIAGAVGEEPGKPKGLLADRDEREERDDADQGTSERTPLLSRHDSARPINASDRARRAAAEFQTRADRVFEAFSIADSCPRYQDGETFVGYQQKILSKLKRYSSAWSKADLYSIRDGATLAVAADQIFADAYAAASAPPSVGSGVLRAVEETDRTGRKITRFFGDPEATWGMFKQQPRRMVGINLKPQG
jgi:hypothetical protein